MCKYCSKCTINAGICPTQYLNSFDNSFPLQKTVQSFSLPPTNYLSQPYDSIVSIRHFNEIKDCKKFYLHIIQWINKK